MLFVIIDIIDRLQKYLKPFALALEKEEVTAPAPPPIPDPRTAQSPRENFLADSLIQPLVDVDDTDQDSKLADYIAKTKKDPRNDGPRKLGSVYRKDRVTPVYLKLKFTTTIWNELFLTFSKYFSISWEET